MISTIEYMKDSELTQLRLDKIIYAVEAIAINTLFMLIYIVLPEIWGGVYTSSGEILGIRHWVFITMLTGAVTYNLYMGIGNFKRLRKIKAIENKQKA